MTRLNSDLTGDLGARPWESAGYAPDLGAMTRPAACAHPPQNVGEVERWGSIAAGALLALAGLTRGRSGGLLMGLIGAGLLHRGITGHCYAYDALGMDTTEHNPATAIPAQEGVKVEHSIAIAVPAERLFSFWRDVENLPRVMRHLQRVEALDRQRSHWVALGPLGVAVEWDAEIFNERENEMIAWRSLPGGDIETAGSVRFRPLGDGRGTVLTVSMKYNPPGGKVGEAIASLLGSGLEQEMAEDLRRFKTEMEAGQASSLPPGTA
jgi:uncharacterized membrane protein